jgi:putative ABC transport system permease protein
VRKVLGAYRYHLVGQFLGEALLITFIAVLLSVLLTDLTLPLFNGLLSKTLRYTLLENPIYIQGLLGILLGVTLLSGLYPAIFMSSFNPTEAIKGAKTAAVRYFDFNQFRFACDEANALYEYTRSGLPE